MTPLMKRLTSPSLGGFLLFGALFWACMVYVFYPVLEREWVMMSPDFPKYYPVWDRARYIEAILAGKESFVPYGVVNLILPPLVRQELFFMLTTFFAGLAVFYYLRTQQVSRIAAYGGGLCFALSGYSFTLFCAGHGGYFELLTYGLFAYGLLNRCFQSRNLFYFALLGATVMWAEIHQPDIWLLFMFLVAAYGVWRSVREWRATRSAAFLLRVYPRFLVTAAVIALIGSRQIKVALTETLSAREKQLTDVSSAAQKAPSADAAGVDKQKAFERWIFMTNWSLPPEDMLEFVVPGIFGNDSFQAPYPYWGRLGQPYGFQKGRMMPNYRQHSVYLGVVAVLLAVFALWGYLATRRKTSECAAGACDREAGPDFSDVPFWAGAWLVCAVIALGRYTPVYRLAYQLPFMDYLRAPVKFHHLVEISSAFLTGFGIQFFMSAWPRVAAARKRFVFFCVGLAGCLAAGVFVIHLNAASIERHIGELGLGQVAATLRHYAAANMWRSVLLAGSVAVVFFWASRFRASSRAIAWCACALVAVNTVDLADAARRHVIPMHVGAHHEANAVVKAMQARTGGKPAPVMNYVTSNAGYQDWFSTALDLHGFANMAPAPDEGETTRSVLFNTLKNNPLRYWQLTGVRFVLLPRKNAEPLVRQGVLSVLCDFELGQGSVRKTAPSASSLALAEVVGYPVLPALYPDWVGPVAAESQVDALKDGALTKPVAEVGPVAGGSAGAPVQRVEFEAMRKMPSALATRGRINAARASLLISTEPFAADLEAFVDGVPVRVYQANALWAAVPVPQGEHQIVLRQKRAWGMNAVSIATTLLLLGWFLARCVRSAPND